MTEPSNCKLESAETNDQIRSYQLNHLNETKKKYRSTVRTRFIYSNGNVNIKSVVRRHNGTSTTVSTASKIRKNKSRRIKKNVQAILSTSSAHGLNRLFTTKRILFKVMWLNFFICSASCGIYMVTNSITDYFKYEVVTQMKIIQEAPTQFPTVTFYNLKNHYDNLTLRDILLSCTFNSKSCDDTDFETKLDRAGNVFYQFNNGRNKAHQKVDIKNVMQSGKSYGLQVELVCFY